MIATKRLMAWEFGANFAEQDELHRWYDATVGAWISQDPIGFAAGDANLYRYVGNGVTKWVDPSGLQRTDLSDPDNLRRLVNSVKEDNGKKKKDPTDQIARGCIGLALARLGYFDPWQGPRTPVDIKDSKLFTSLDAAREHIRDEGEKENDQDNDPDLTIVAVQLPQGTTIDDKDGDNEIGPSDIHTPEPGRTDFNWATDQGDGNWEYLSHGFVPNGIGGIDGPRTRENYGDTPPYHVIGPLPDWPGPTVYLVAPGAQ